MMTLFVLRGASVVMRSEEPGSRKPHVLTIAFGGLLLVVGFGGLFFLMRTRGAPQPIEQVAGEPVKPESLPIVVDEWNRILEDANRYAKVITKLGDYESLVMREAHASWQAQMTGRLSDADYQRSKLAIEIIQKIGIENASPQQVEDANLGFAEVVINLKTPIVATPVAKPAEVFAKFPLHVDYDAARADIENLKLNTPSARIVQARARRELSKKDRLTPGELKRLQDCGLVWHAYARSLVSGKENLKTEIAAKAWAKNVSIKSKPSTHLGGESLTVFWGLMGTLSDAQIGAVQSEIEKSNRALGLPDLLGIVREMK